MSGYALKYVDSIEARIKGIDKSMLEAIQQKIEWLAANAEEIRHQALKGKNYKHQYKLRVGDFRVVYVLSHSERLITVREIAHRSKIYRER